MSESTESTDLQYSEVEQELRGNVRALLAARAPQAATLARTESEQPVDTALWRALADELGVTGLAVPEKWGGAGAGWRETAVVLEELGRAAAPVPYLGSAVLATAALLAAEETELLPRVASGELVAALAVPFGTAPSAPFPSAVRTGSDGRLHGRARLVADARTAGVLLVPALDRDGSAGLYAVEDFTVVPVVSLDMTRPLADLVLDAAAGRRIASGDAAVAVLGTALATGAALLASEQLGVAEWALETTTAYVKERHQFGRPVGSFQAVKHRLADLWVSVAQLRAVARSAAAAAATGTDLAVSSALAQAFASPVAVVAAEEAVQLHGGIGFTWEHPAHLYLKRAKSASIALGTADRHRAALAQLVDLTL
ncbi:acyl-CoA dehydrogenase family protein [Streptacidiphilus carbonis]|uniref:acyl-CoA dehydrogenase family protein n=1 Tax=Streptacidiphilus carbonis TaxID=105422 RepID=UPI0005A684A1|nr:acyl-CoA dehydrogenase family protein [Streptacidiphilus carbonis]